MRNAILRDELGRVLGSVDDYWSIEDETWFDVKESELIFPRHNQGKSSPVTVWNMYEQQKQEEHNQHIKQIISELKNN